MSEIKYPDVQVQLTGEDGNAYAIIGAVSKALRREVSADAADDFKAEALASESYDDILRLCMRTVDVL